MGSWPAAAEGATQSGNLLLPQKPRPPRCLLCWASARAELDAESYAGSGGRGRRALLCRLLDVPRFARTLCPLAFGSHRTSAERGAGAPRTYPCLPPPARWAQVRFPGDVPLSCLSHPLRVCTARNPGTSESWVERKYRNKDRAPFLASR